MLKAAITAHWKVYTLIAVVVSASFLVAYSASGFFNGPTTTVDTTMLDVLTYAFEIPQLPQHYSYVGKLLRGQYSCEQFSVTLDLWIEDYVGHVEDWPDLVRLIVVANLTGYDSNTLVESVEAAFNCTGGSVTQIGRYERDFVYLNLSLVDRSDDASTAYLDSKGANQSSSAHLWQHLEWVLPGQKDYEFNVSFESTFYNGTAYHRIVQPYLVHALGVTGS